MSYIQNFADMAEYIHLALKKEAVVVVDKETETVIKYIPGTNIEIGYKEGIRLRRTIPTCKQH